MKPGSISSAVFALACFACAVVSARILGPGMWGSIFMVGGLFVGASPYLRSISALGRVVALLMAIVSFLAIGLGLLAATIGGSFRLPDDQGFLLALFGVIGLSGLVYARAKTKEDGRQEDSA